MSVKKESVSVATLGGGVILPRLDAELQRVASNILDPDTKATAAREITLKIKIKPDDQRDFASVEIAVGAKLAAAKPQATKVFINQTRSGDVIVSERDTRNGDLFEAEGETPAPNVPPSIAARKAEADAE